MNILGKKRKISVNIILVLLLISTFLGCLGSPGFKIIFENTTHETLTIYLDNYKVGEVSSQQQISYDHALWDSIRYLVEAKNLKEETIFSKTLTRETMEKIGTKIYKVIITTSENSTIKNLSENSTPINT